MRSPRRRYRARQFLWRLPSPRSWSQLASCCLFRKGKAGEPHARASSTAHRRSYVASSACAAQDSSSGSAGESRRSAASCGTCAACLVLGGWMRHIQKGLFRAYSPSGAAKRLAAARSEKRPLDQESVESVARGVAGPQSPRRLAAASAGGRLSGLAKGQPTASAGGRLLGLESSERGAFGSAGAGVLREQRAWLAGPWSPWRLAATRSGGRPLGLESFESGARGYAGPWSPRRLAAASSEGRLLGLAFVQPGACFLSPFLGFCQW